MTSVSRRCAYAGQGRRIPDVGRAVRLVKGWLTGFGQAGLEPFAKLGFGDIAGHNINDEIVETVVATERQDIAAVGDENFGRQPCRSLVGITEAMGRRQPVEEGGGFSLNEAMIAVIGTPDGTEYIVEVRDAAQTAEGIDGLLVRFQYVTEPDPIVPLTDWRAAEARPCFC